MGEVSLDGDGLARDSGAAAVYRPILEAYISDGSIKGRLIRSASKHVEAQVNQFVDWFRDHEEEYETGYLDDQAEQKDVSRHSLSSAVSTVVLTVSSSLSSCMTSRQKALAASMFAPARSMQL